MEDSVEHTSKREGEEQQGQHRKRPSFCGCLCLSGEERGVAAVPSKVKKKRLWKGRKMRSDGDDEQIGIRDLQGVINGDSTEPRPDHLVIMVNGIIGSAADWRFTSQRMRSKLGRHVAIHCSVNNSALKTFDGVDVMGMRLASEVREIVNKTQGLTRISFLAHSLGGLVSRYAIAQLYSAPILHVADVGGDKTGLEPPSEPTIGGLQPENFITLATPHLGCRGADQLPFLYGIQALERAAPSLAHLFIGKTGKHLFLADGTERELPLLRKMVMDCKEGQFISSLGSFKRRVAYANVANDHMVGWRTASIRLKSEKADLDRKAIVTKYPHVIREEEPVPPLGEYLIVELLREEGKHGDDAIEEEMVAGLSQLAWHRVDVRFKGERGSYQAHNLIQVKNPRTHYMGVDVIEHVIDKHFSADHLDATT